MFPAAASSSFPIRAALAGLTAALAPSLSASPVPGPQTPAQAEMPATPSGDALDALRWRSVGPIRGGRSIAVGGVTSRPNEYYFGATGGGLWKTDNSGASWYPVGDGRFRSSSVGAIEVCEADPDVVYIGFGEVQLRGNVIPGDGVYRTSDGGRTWTHLGLESATGQQTIGRIRVRPDDCDVVFVAAFGDPFGPNEERGVFRSLDGGQTWRKVLYRGDSAGAVDIALARNRPGTLYAGFWEAYRKPWLLWSGGEGSGLFRSVDDGETWTELTRRPGLPTGLWGKVAVSISGADPNLAYANIEAREGGVFVTRDGGESWTRTSGDRNLRTRAFYYTRITADPVDRNTVYVNNENFWRSRDGGLTWDRIRVPHEDNHDLWIDPANNQRMIQANDGGANISLDGGRSWTGQAYPTAQMYTVSTTHGFPYHVCGTQQDNTSACVPSDGDGSWWYPVGGGESGWVVPDPDDPAVYFTGSQTNQVTVFSRATGQLRSISPWPIRTVGRSAADVSERFQWTFPIAVSPQTPRALYVGSQHLWRSTDRGRSWARISPDLTYADPSTLGPSGGPLTLDRTTVEHYATLFAIAPSPHDPGTIWVGSDDGRVHLTRDGGGDWEEVTPPDLPRFGRVNFIDASEHRPGKALVAVGRYRMQDVAPYIWKTGDFGRTWRPSTTGIRHGDHVRAVLEDPVREGLLFAGTENGVYFSIDDGEVWQSLQLNLPVSPAYALAIAGRDLVVATHGRSFYVLDDITPLRQWTPEVVSGPAHLFRPATAIRSKGRPPEGYARASSVGGANIDYYLRDPVPDLTVEILDIRGGLVREWIIGADEAGSETAAASREAGLHRIHWDLRYPGHTTFPGLMLRFSRGDGPMAPPGRYRARLTVEGREVAVEEFAVEKDPRLTDVSQADFEEQFRLATAVRDRTSDAHEAVIRIRDLAGQVAARLERTPSDAVRRAGEALVSRIGEVERALYEVRLEAPEDQLNFGLKLNNDLAVLLVEIETGDGPPTPSQHAVFGELSALLREQLDALEEALAEHLPELNRLLAGESLEPVAPTARGRIPQGR